MRINTPISRYTVAILLGVALIATLTPGVLAQATTPTPIYDGAATPDQDGWMGNRTNSSIDNVAHMTTRVATFFIGGSGGAYATFTGLLIGLAFVGLLGVSRGGIAVGAVAGVVSAAVLAEVGLAEQWVYAVLLMVVGIVLAVVYFRLKR